MKNLLIIAALAFALLNNSVAQTTNSPDGIVGTWTTQDGTAKVKIEKINGKYSGKFVWLNPASDKNGNPILDSKNSEKSLQTRTLMGLPLLQNFVFDGDNVWTKGTIYNPDDGDTYSCKITLVNNETMDVRGYVGFSLFGSTETWKRTKDVAMK